MKKLSDQESAYTKTSIRLPTELRDALKASAHKNGRTMNAEILARVMEAEDRATFRQLTSQNDELRTLMREMLDQIELLKK